MAEGPFTSSKPARAPWSSVSRKQNKGSKIAQWVKVHGHQVWQLDFDPWDTWQERTDSWKLFSDHHIHTRSRKYHFCCIYLVRVRMQRTTLVSPFSPSNMWIQGVEREFRLWGLAAEPFPHLDPIPSVAIMPAKTWVFFFLMSLNKINWIWWCMPIHQSTWEAEARSVSGRMKLKVSLDYMRSCLKNK